VCSLQSFFFFFANTDWCRISFPPGAKGQQAIWSLW
jgi:hypothetical protein